MTDITALRIDLLESFEQLLSSLTAFIIDLKADHRYPIWVSRSETEIDNNYQMRDKSINLFQSLWYEDGQDGRETLTCPGIIGAGDNTITSARACNIAKDKFKTSVLALKQLGKAQQINVMEELHKRNQNVALSMQRLGAARLNLKQAYRHIPTLPQCPLKIGFTWSKQGRTIQRTSVAEARRLLERRTESPQVQRELQRLASITETETLARVRSVCPHLRANIVFATETADVERRLMQAPLPIVVPLTVNQSLPEFVPIPPEPIAGARLKRSDVRIEDEVFLPLLRIHRYKEVYRDISI